MTTQPTAQHSAQIIAWNVEGVPVAEQRARLAALGVAVSRQALYKFRKRHADGIDEPKARVARAVVETATLATIAEKQERLRRAGIASDKVMEWIEAHGLVTETQTVGDEGEEIIDRRFNRGIVSALVDLNTYAAKELGQMPTGAPQGDVPTEWTQINITVDNRRLSVTPEARRARRQERIIDG